MAGRARKWILWLSALAVLGILAFVGTSIATDRSAFCATCHEMKPYNKAWAAGLHAKSAECVDCHVDHSELARLAHKFVALKEVWRHFAGDTTFPRPTPPQVPDDRCLRCHGHMPAAIDGFRHGLHVKKAVCQVCHYDTGHTVTDAALEQAGVFNPGVKIERPKFAKASVGAGRANLPGHPSVSCTRCHDMKATPCKSCHQPPEGEHPVIGSRDCSACHEAAVAFRFRHPAAGAECARCHTAPKDDHPAIGARKCASCHRLAGRSWAFSHPTSGDCARCHARPAKHFKGTCTECHHNPGRSWAFRHRGNTGEHSYRSFACVKCHPVSYRAARCTCHVDGGVPRDD